MSVFECFSHDIKHRQHIKKFFCKHICNIKLLNENLNFEIVLKKSFKVLYIVGIYGSNNIFDNK